jgi:type IV pilus assembly protein PilC
MAQAYSYRARNLSGGIVTGRIQADSVSAVNALLRARNLFVVQVKQARPQTAIGMDLDIGLIFKNAFKLKIGVRTLAIFCRQFGTMNQAGIPILQCLQILSKQAEDGQMKKVLGGVTAEIEKGSGLSEAFRKHKQYFPDIFISMIAAGELSGTMDQAMDRLAVTFEKDSALRSKIQSAMTYPMVIAGMALIAVISLLIFVVPTFVDIFKQAGAPLPLPTLILVGLSNVMIHYWWLILPLLFIVIPVGIKQTLATKRGRRAMDRILLRMPILGNMITKNVVARFSRNLATLLKSGIPLVQALETVEEIVGNTVAAEDIARARANIKEGDLMSPVLAASKFFPPMTVSMIAVGEESGSLDVLLEKLAVFYEQEVEAIVAGLSSTIEPLMILGVGCLIGFIAISIYLPLFGLSGAMQAGSGVPLP